jgi:hypothetical protein
MKNPISALLTRYRRPAPVAQPIAIETKFTVVTNDWNTELKLHEGDLIHVEREFSGFLVAVAMLRPHALRALPLAHCETLREAEMLRMVLCSKLAIQAESFDVRNRPQFINGNLVFKEKKNV